MVELRKTPPVAVLQGVARSPDELLKEIELIYRNRYSAFLRVAVDRDVRWRVIRGTKAYAGLRGRGTLTGRYRFTGIDATMTGTVMRSSVRSRHP